MSTHVILTHTEDLSLHFLNIKLMQDILFSFSLTSISRMVIHFNQWISLGAHNPELKYYSSIFTSWKFWMRQVEALLTVLADKFFNIWSCCDCETCARWNLCLEWSRMSWQCQVAINFQHLKHVIKALNCVSTAHRKHVSQYLCLATYSTWCDVSLRPPTSNKCAKRN